jgi:hypothetical protein
MRDRQYAAINQAVRTITVYPGEITRDSREVQYQMQKMRDQGCTNIEYQQIEDHTAQLVGWMDGQ